MGGTGSDQLQFQNVPLLSDIQRMYLDNTLGGLAKAQEGFNFGEAFGGPFESSYRTAPFIPGIGQPSYELDPLANTGGEGHGEDIDDPEICKKRCLEDFTQNLKSAETAEQRAAARRVKAACLRGCRQQPGKKDDPRDSLSALPGMPPGAMPMPISPSGAAPPMQSGGTGWSGVLDGMAPPDMGGGGMMPPQGNPAMNPFSMFLQQHMRGR